MTEGIMNKPPETIYLQCYDDFDEYLDHMKTDVTWCVDKINDNDAEYCLVKPDHEINETYLIELGWEKILWNRTIPEYWITTRPNWKSDEKKFDHRVGVRFGSYGMGLPEDFCVWFVTGSSSSPLPNIRTIGQLKQFCEFVISRRES